MKNIYLLFAILGAIIPYVFFLNFIQINGVNIPIFVQSLFVNGAAGGFSADLLISSFVFWIFMFNENRRKNGHNPIIFIMFNLLIGLSCALPAYFYVKEASKSDAAKLST